MVKKKTAIRPVRPDIPIYPIGVAARLVGVHPRTLRIYEKEGLITPAVVGSRRMFSENDVRWITCLRRLIHEQGISIPGLKKLLRLAPCWEIAECPAEVHEQCEARVDRALPRVVHVAGDNEAARAAKAQEQQERLAPAVEKKKQGSSG